MANKNFSNFVVEYSLTINDFLEQALEQRVNNPKLREILAYSVLAPGKRIRPMLFLATILELGQEITTEHIKIAGGIELIHTYSLIHDDLPAMDNDEYRRGRLTSHVKFSEADAILAGDALLTLGLNWMAVAKVDPEISKQVIEIMTDASGVNGMIEGQFLDVTSTKQELTAEEVDYLESKKTADLIIGAVKAGAVVGHANVKQFEHLTNYAEKYGRAFQIYDDLVDIKENSSDAGKETSKDAKRGKNTYISAHGQEKAEADLIKLMDEMKEEIAGFDFGVLSGFTNLFKKVLVDD